MCGIALVAGAQGPADFPDLLTLLQRRGPDSQSSVQIPLPQTEMTVMASLLQLRGSTPSSCPLTHVSGAVLAFNGEVFGGLQVPVGTSDAATLLQALCGIPDQEQQQEEQQEQREEQESEQQQEEQQGEEAAVHHIARVLSQLRGPWALLFWHPASQSLWFGRDVLGPAAGKGAGGGRWLELPPGLYRLQLQPTQCRGDAAAQGVATAPGKSVQPQAVPAGVEARALGEGAGEAGEDMAPTQEMAQATGGGPSLGDRGGCGGGLGQGAGAGSCKSEGLNGSVTGGDVVEWLSSSSMQGPGQVPLPLQLGLSSWQLWRVAWADPLVQQLAGFDRLPGPLASPAQPAAADDACQAGRPGQVQGEGQGQGQGHTARVHKQRKGQGNGVQQPHEGGELRPGLRDLCRPQAVPRNVAAALLRRQQAGGAGAASDLQLLAQLAAQPRVEAAVTATLAALAQAVKVRCQSIDLVSRPCQGPPLAASAPGAKLPLPGIWLLLKIRSRHVLVLLILFSTSALNLEPSLQLNTLSPAVLILFSGGVDSSLLAALAHACLPLEQPIELCNICFNAGRSPDRQAAHSALQELVRLGPQRPWRLIEVEASLEEVDQHSGQAYTSPARVVLLGHGADEQCGGYGRHRTRFATAGWPGLAEELALDMRRMWLRNLGRDDRLVADWGREARHPFLDEELVRVLQASSLPDIVDLSHPPGVGDKLVLRAALLRLGLPQAAIRVKRAIQFGSEIGKLSNVREFGSNRAANKQSAGYVSIRLAQHAKSKAHSEAIGMAQRAGGGASSIKAAVKAATTTVVQGTYRRMVLAALFMVFYEGLMALPPIGKEYQQGYKRVNDWLPKVKQRLHRAAEYRRGIDGGARKNA
ncbi:hypothetical protein QJQ45_027646 [Haematococcus lacustris]|nr:hypothetical protein QJQ45_027646 [Haematococcus lacustris]